MRIRVRTLIREGERCFPIIPRETDWSHSPLQGAQSAPLPCTEGSLYSRIEKAAADQILTGDTANWAHDVRLDANDQCHR
jgi:hypothetical protein